MIDIMSSVPSIFKVVREKGVWADLFSSRELWCNDTGHNIHRSKLLEEQFACIR
jgi:hypothetical protein